MTSVARPRPRKNGDKSQHNGVLRALRAHVHRPMECVSHPEKYPHTLGMIVIAMRLAATDCRSEIRDQQIKSFTMGTRRTTDIQSERDRRSSIVIITADAATTKKNAIARDSTVKCALAIDLIGASACADSCDGA